MLEGLEERLLAPELVSEIVRGFQEEVDAMQGERRASAAQRARKRAYAR